MYGQLGQDHSTPVAERYSLVKEGMDFPVLHSRLLLVSPHCDGTGGSGSSTGRAHSQRLFSFPCAIPRIFLFKSRLVPDSAQSGSSQLWHRGKGTTGVNLAQELLSPGLHGVPSPATASRGRIPLTELFFCKN